jgi:hypothetical protein
MNYHGAWIEGESDTLALIKIGSLTVLEQGLPEQKRQLICILDWRTLGAFVAFASVFRLGQPGFPNGQLLKYPTRREL